MDQGTHTWRKSSYSGTDDNCVEVAHLPQGDQVIRDSKNPTGPVLRFTASEWRAFVSDTKTGRFVSP
ncbi:DUF397 domain-containing protein [Sphaerisporangium sp. NPDC004334]